MLADASQSAPLIGNWMIGALFFFQIAALIAQLVRWNKVDKREIHPQPLEVKGATEFTPRKLFDQHAEENRREHENLFARLGGMERGIKSEVKQDFNAIHDKVNQVAREVSEHSATLELQNQRLASIDAKLDRLVESERRPR